MGKQWTKQEKEFMAEHGSQLPDKELAGRLGRSEGAIQSYRYRNDIYKGGDNHYSCWTGAEEDIIRRHWPRSDKDLIAKLLPGRTMEAITTHAQQMGVSRSAEFRKKTQFKAKNLIEHTASGTLTVRQVSSGQKYMYLNTPSGSIPFHHILWERENGPIPDGHCLKCKSEETSCPDPENWKLVSIKEHLGKYAVPVAGAKALKEYISKNGSPGENLTDNFVAGVLAQGDEELKQMILEEQPELINVARANYKLTREINHGSH